MSQNKHSEYFEKVKKWYNNGRRWTKEMVKNAVEKWITADEYAEITGEEYAE